MDYVNEMQQISLLLFISLKMLRKT